MATTQTNNVPIAGKPFNLSGDPAAARFGVACRTCPWTHWTTSVNRAIAAATAHAAQH